MWRKNSLSIRLKTFTVFKSMHPHIQINCLIWSWIQLSILLISTSYLFANIATIVSPGIFVYGLFIFFSVYSFTELMDRHRFALLWEIMKNVLGFFVIYKTGGWFSASPSVSLFNIPIILWLLLSTFITAWFVFIEFKHEEKVSYNY